MKMIFDGVLPKHQGFTKTHLGRIGVNDAEFLEPQVPL